jgi:shikimate kinase
LTERIAALMKNVILIGMPGAGKSTIGVILAKVLGFGFIDSDLLIQEQEGCLLKDIIEAKGQKGFRTIENQVNRKIITDNCVIATGGSVIYCPESMEHFRKNGVVVYIKLSCETIENRLGNIRQRGVVYREGQTLRSLYEERCPLYEKYAQCTVDGEGLEIEVVMEKIANAVRAIL